MLLTLITPRYHLSVGGKGAGTPSPELLQLTQQWFLQMHTHKAVDPGLPHKTLKPPGLRRLGSPISPSLKSYAIGTYALPSVMADWDGMSMAFSFKLWTYLIWSTMGISRFKPCRKMYINTPCWFHVARHKHYYPSLFTSFSLVFSNPGGLELGTW